jgi:hypothetical protein
MSLFLAYLTCIRVAFNTKRALTDCLRLLFPAIGVKVSYLARPQHSCLSRLTTLPFCTSLLMNATRLSYDDTTRLTGNEYPSPPESVGSRDSNESLRALELSDGPLAPPRRVRSYSMAALDFQTELLPLSASTEVEVPSRPEAVEKNISVTNGV